MGVADVTRLLEPDTSLPACSWCGARATATIRDERRTRLTSGTTVRKGPGTTTDVCDACAARLSARYGARS